MCLFTQTTIETYFSKLLFLCSRHENAFAGKIYVFFLMKVKFYQTVWFSFCLTLAILKLKP